MEHTLEAAVLVPGRENSGVGGGLGIWNMRPTVFLLRYLSAVNACLHLSSKWFFKTDEVKGMEAGNERVLLNVFWRNACQVEPNWRGKLARGHAK